jgi:hypothetical protein
VGVCVCVGFVMCGRVYMCGCVCVCVCVCVGVGVCGCFVNTYTCIYCVLYFCTLFFYCLFYVYLFLFVFVCTSVRTAATE